MSAQGKAPATADELRDAIIDRFASLSKRLQQIGCYILDEPNAIALETLAVISERCGVQPSAIVRFAKAFGFEGASQMQRLFRDGLMNSSAGLGYADRIRQLTATTSANDAAPVDLLAEFIEGNTLALRQLLDMVSKADMTRAVALIDAAATVAVVGYRRSFPVASYLSYSLLQVGKRVIFIDGVAGLGLQQARTLGFGDLLIAISFHPYAEETVAVVDVAREQGADVLTIGDSLVSPTAKPAAQVLQVRESEVRGFRSLSASMCLAQALVINLAFAAAQGPSDAT